MLRQFPKTICWLFYWVIFNPAANAAPVNFNLPDLDGKTVQIADYRGKWVLVNFWASWCGPCIKELPELALFQAKHAQQVQVIGLNFEDTRIADTKAFLATLPATGFPHVKDDGKGLGTDFFVDKEGNTISLQGLPSTFFINPQGELFDHHIGPLTEAGLAKKLRDWTGKHPIPTPTHPAYQNTLSPARPTR